MNVTTEAWESRDFYPNPGALSEEAAEASVQTTPGVLQHQFQ